jgi:hypothetical protein
MLCFELREKFLDVNSLPSLGLFEALTDALISIGAGRNVEEALIGLRVLHHRGGLALHVSTKGRLLFLSCFMKSPERRRKVVSD